MEVLEGDRADSLIVNLAFVLAGTVEKIYMTITIFLVPMTFMSLLETSPWALTFFAPNSSVTCPFWVIKALPAAPWTLAALDADTDMMTFDFSFTYEDAEILSRFNPPSELGT